MNFRFLRPQILLTMLLLAPLSWPAPLRAQVPAPSTSQPGDGSPDRDHGAQPNPANGLPAQPSSSPEEASPKPSAAPGLALPSTGLFWALDSFQGTTDLVHLKYSYVTFNRHLGSNILKAQVAPFVAKMKGTVELQGPSAAIRLHTTTPVFYVRGILQNEADESADDPRTAPTASHLALLHLKVKKQKRVSSTIDFTQITGTAHRSETAIPIRIEPVAGTNWQKITPLEPLDSGEYAIMPVFNGQAIFSPTAFDFAVDPTAPQNTDVVLPRTPLNQGKR